MTVWNVLAATGASWLAGLLWYRAFAAKRGRATAASEATATAAAAAAGAEAGAGTGAGAVTGAGTGGAAAATPLRLGLAAAGVLFLVAGFLRHIFHVSGLTSNVGLGLVAGLGVGLFFILPALWLLGLAEGRPARLALIDGGFAGVATALMGALLVAF
ncbi:DUF1761 family protein [Rhodovulum sp. DZ06]|uniref:DUF1761 family protein n=1 Tax=Rhodovulum sp. DZ06 TaxID=3425126 RepID=UPI003D331269